MTGPIALSAELAPDMAALMDRVARQDGPQADPTTLPPAEGRRLAAAGNRRWNVDLPEMAVSRNLGVPADAALGGPAIRCWLHVPLDARPGLVVFVHGGGFSFCSPETHERAARLLAAESGLAVLLPDYRLAPEHPYPAGLTDVVATLRALPRLAETADVPPGPLFLAGDSAGANLALASLIHEMRADRPVGAAGALLFYGNYDADFESPSFRFFAEGPGLTRAKMQRYWRFYVGNRDMRGDALACPAFAERTELAALPPLHLMAAGVDPLLSDTLALQARLADAGRSEKAEIVPGVVHGFLQMTHELAAAREAIAAAGRFVRDHS
ncbi:alpha/beta hydrolase [Aurantimonas sp. VKM B-3413]|uniref:alpha/beta hydrolase n=1 Tax=Aurantimonas sp. VKM B-3413 TaxID=2779401 RepID=UPI001E58D3D6|nr:alpha/beta hydrolase [Aurantimonas sp. VKM B-3413]MCB8839436.1 alpha/beta hydrolase [Aurantimonas sp. VKM B-3413]